MKKVDCKQCRHLMSAYGIKKQKEVQKSCCLCVCGQYATAKKTEDVTLEILDKFATGKIFGVPINPRDVAGLVGSKEKSLLGRCVRATGLELKDIPPDVIEEAVHKSVVMASMRINAMNQNNREKWRENGWSGQAPQTRFDYHGWMSIPKPVEEVRMPNAWRNEVSPEQNGSTVFQTRISKGTKFVKVENDRADIEIGMTEGKEGGKRYSLFGYPVTAVIRWMGLDAWTFNDTQRAFAKLRLPVSDSTLRAQLIAGQKGERGDPADLTDEQIEKLYSLLKKETPCQEKKSSKPSSPPAPPANGKKDSSVKKSAKRSSSTVLAVRKSSLSKKSKSQKRHSPR